MRRDNTVTIASHYCKWLSVNNNRVLVMDFSGINGDNHLDVLREKIDIDHICNQDSVCHEVAFETERGEDIWLQVIGCNLMIDDTQIPAILIADATIEKNLEKQIERKNREIKRLIQQKDDFILQIGHDLKTPLTPLISILPLIKRKEKDPRLQELLQTAIENVDRMKIQIDKILKFAKLKSFGTEYHIHPVLLYPIIEDVLQCFKPDFKQHNIKVMNGVDESMYVHADPHRLKEVFNQLVKNSIQFSSEKGAIKIYAEKMADMITISFQDNGIGLNKDQIDHIFDEFYKSDDSRHAIGSSGVGLSYCKTIIKKHGGDIWSFSQGGGKGVTFYITLKNGEQ